MSTIRMSILSVSMAHVCGPLDRQNIDETKQSSSDRVHPLTNKNDRMFETKLHAYVCVEQKSVNCTHLIVSLCNENGVDCQCRVSCY